MHEELLALKEELHQLDTWGLMGTNAHARLNEPRLRAERRCEVVRAIERFEYLLACAGSQG